MPISIRRDPVTRRVAKASKLFLSNAGKGTRRFVVKALPYPEVWAYSFSYLHPRFSIAVWHKHRTNGIIPSVLIDGYQIGQQRNLYANSLFGLSDDSR